MQHTCRRSRRESSSQTPKAPPANSTARRASVAPPGTATQHTLLLQICIMNICRMYTYMYVYKPACCESMQWWTCMCQPSHHATTQAQHDDMVLGHWLSRVLGLKGSAGEAGGAKCIRRTAPCPVAMAVVRPLLVSHRYSLPAVSRKPFMHKHRGKGYILYVSWRMRCIKLLSRKVGSKAQSAWRASKGHHLRCHQRRPESPRPPLQC